MIENLDGRDLLGSPFAYLALARAREAEGDDGGTIAAVSDRCAMMSFPIAVAAENRPRRSRERGGLSPEAEKLSISGIPPVRSGGRAGTRGTRPDPGSTP